MLNGEQHQSAKNKYGAMAVNAAFRKYNALLARQLVNGLSEEEVAQRNFYQDEFGFEPPKAEPEPNHNHYFGGY